MGPAFVILFWLIIAAVVGAIWLVSMAAFLASWARKRRFAKWVSAVPALGIPLLAVLVAGILAYGLVRSAIPSCVYRDVFHTAPGKDVSDIESQVFWFADTGSIWLQFKCDEATFRNIMPAGCRAATSHTDHDAARDALKEAPSWWKAGETLDAKVYIEESSHDDDRSIKGFAFETLVIRYSPASRIAQYRFVGID